MTMAECDHCGVREQVPDQSAAFTHSPIVKIPLPEGWGEVALRELMADAVSPAQWQLCESCVNALRQFLEGDSTVPGLLELEVDDVLRLNVGEPDVPVEDQTETGPPPVTQHKHFFLESQDDCGWPGCTLTYGVF